ncbi:glycoside hydrolase family 79 protein [Daedaleopsis nitida]|nr:glycoside hydrolase family 79 protein [Daedaleopsis nitida]
MPTPSQCVLAIIVAPLLAHIVGAIDVSVPLTPPSGAQTLSRTLLSFSIEQDNWPDWTGISSRNEFVHTTLENLGALTGQPPKIRVGANSEDRTVFSPTVDINQDEFPPANSTTPYPEADSITVGDGYYQLSRFLPSGTHMTWGVNLGADNVTNAVNMINSIIKAFETSAVQGSGVVLDLVEVGNEPDFYELKGLRSSNWTVDEYVTDWISVAGSVAQAAGITGRNGPVSLQGAAFAEQDFTPQEIFDLGILDSTPGKAISVISQHHYSTVPCDGGNVVLVSFMDKASIRSNLTIFNADIAATQAQGLTYILGETNNVALCHGATGVSETAGIALWVVDYTLQASTLGIREAFFHQGVGFKYNFIQPVSLNRSILDNSPLDPPAPPHVQPAYYAGLVINTLIGSTGASQITELTVDDSNVSGYAAFEAGKLVRAVFVNLHPWLTTSTDARPSVHIDFAFAGGSKTGTASVRRLVIQHADDTANVTWAGQSFETSSGAPSGSVVMETVDLSEGLDLPATQAVLVDF